MSIIENSWRSRGLIAALLLPISWIFRALLSLRRLAYAQGWKSRSTVPLPVVVVGNLSVGGTGKTPLCAYLVERFKDEGWKPAIVSRGYGGKRWELPHLVSANDSPVNVGDEPVLLFEQTGVPVSVCVHRALAVKKIAEHTDADIVFSDDGLQHLSMPRVAEVLVVDGQRGFGNAWVLPAGPLRDSFSSLQTINMVAIQVPSKVNSNHNDENSTLHRSLDSSPLKGAQAFDKEQQFSLIATSATELNTEREVMLQEFVAQKVHAVAGIGHPQRFFDSLTRLGVTVIEHAKADHADYCLADISFNDDLPILVTVKDAVKIKQIDALPDNIWQINTRVEVSAALDSAVDKLQQKLAIELKQ